MPHKKKLTVWDFPLENSSDLNLLESAIKTSLKGGKPRFDSKLRTDLLKYAAPYASEPIVCLNADQQALFNSLYDKKKYAIVDDRTRQVIAQVVFLTDDERTEQERLGYRAILWSEVELNLAKSGKSLTGKLKPVIFEATGKTKPGVRYLRATYRAYADNELNGGLYDLLRRVQVAKVSSKS